MLLRKLVCVLVLAGMAVLAAPTAAAESPVATVSQLYAHYLAAVKLGPKGNFTSKPYLEPSFHALIARAYAIEAACAKRKKSCLIVDWDIFDGAQVPLYAYSVEGSKARITGSTALVPVNLTYEWDGKAGGKGQMLVQLTKTPHGWLVSDLLPSLPKAKSFSTRASIQHSIDMEMKAKHSK